nr:MAG: hypothetical protein DIU78_17040 [Pseudomonadota bacterium]
MRELNLRRFAGVCSAAPWAVLRREEARSKSRKRRVASLYESPKFAVCPRERSEPAVSEANRVGELEGR